MRPIVINEGPRSSVKISDTRRIEIDFTAPLMRRAANLRKVFSPLLDLSYFSYAYFEYTVELSKFRGFFKILVLIFDYFSFRGLGRYIG